MRLGTETGSVVNWVASGSVAPPVVGEGATFLHWTDRSAGTVTRVSPSGKTAWVRPDTSILTSGSILSESQVYRYEPCPEAAEIRVRLTGRGWRAANGCGVSFGRRDAYRDPSF